MLLSKFNVQKVSNWLKSNGFQVLASTNNYEVLRFKSSEATGLVYRNKHGKLNFNEYAETAYSFYKAGMPWPAPEKKLRQRLDILTRTILDRDGDSCFYCGVPMPADDMTREHILAVNSGGPNHIDNMALAHLACNKAAGHLPIVQKIELRDRFRAKLPLLTDAVDE